MGILRWFKDGLLALVGCGGAVTVAVASLGMSDDCRTRFFAALRESIVNAIEQSGGTIITAEGVTYHEAELESALRTVLNFHVNEQGQPVDCTIPEAEEMVATVLHALGEKGEKL